MPMPDKNSRVRHPTRSVVTLVIAFAIGVVLMPGMATLFGDSIRNPAGDEGGSASSIVANIAFVTIAVFLALAVHEVGHAIGGSLRGMRLGMLIVGPVHIQRGIDGRLRWRFNRKLSYAGGVVSCVPRSADGIRRAMLSFAAGGPVTSLVVGVAVLAIYSLSDPPGVAAATQGPVWNALAQSVFVLGVSSIGIGLVTLLPVNQGAVANDGKRILRLLRPGPVADGYAAVMGLGGQMIAGVRPRDWDAGLVAQAITLADDSYEDLAGRHMAHSHALDREDVAAAAEHIRYLVGHVACVPAAYRPVIEIAAAYFEAACDGDVASARSRLAGAGNSAWLALDPTARIRAEGVILLAEGDAAGAYEKLREAYTSLAGVGGLGSESTMAEVRRLCRARGLPDPGAGRAG